MRVCLLFTLLAILPSLPAPAADKADAAASRNTHDARLGKPRGLRDAYHPWSPPATADAWNTEKEAIRRRVLVSQGLWPMPPRPEIEAFTHSRIDREDYTIEKVYFASHPGHYVTGNLYRPKGRTGKLPGVLCPHGHWPNGRFYDAGEAKQKAQLDKEAEQTEAGARYPVQARMVHLARMGYVVFHYDMVGYADSRQIGHRAGFTDATAGLWLQNFMGLQTFNSIRALDFLAGLPDVDPERLAVTGSSGGGTQTFMLCAVDPRPAVAFPAVMVSTGMQGGCVCENASYLRIGLNNVALAAVFAPKPMAMSGADDWTIAIETRGLPELQQVYRFFDRGDHVAAKAYPQFKHNYNQVAREMMYAWFHEHLSPDMDQPLTERDFEPVPPAELAVLDDSHQLPADAVDAAGLRKYLTETSQRQFAMALPKNKQDVQQYVGLVRPALEVMLDASVPPRDDITANVQTKPWGNLRLTRGTVGHAGEGDRVPLVMLTPENFAGSVVVWMDGQGQSHLFGDDGEPTAAVRKLLAAGHAVASADVLLTGSLQPESGKVDSLPVNGQYHGFTFCYNRPLLSSRVRDILLTVGAVRGYLPGTQTVHLAGTGEAGPWVLLARALAGDAVSQTVADANGFSFGRIKATSDSMFLPGALKYGGLGGLAAAAVPAPLTIGGTRNIAASELAPLNQVYEAAGAPLGLTEGPLNADRVADILLAE